MRAEVADVPHLSAHADQWQLLGWLRAAAPPHVTCLVHGESEGSEALGDRMDHGLDWGRDEMAPAAVPRTSGRAAAGAGPVTSADQAEVPAGHAGVVLTVDLRVGRTRFHTPPVYPARRPR
ncbi:MBL fold metallo-hydrolase RNA specificity domain-containing protein [Streptomyces sp. NBRC 110611]|uniref:MBL fold metallo-hydrolase RNA specificity domain-containing protein n=1 Tax=Streptomyces sp. NBRC 110611 TaxID=1621259 RepID=UPI00215D080F|nr:MBL fold metallo-hydrolase RNA specificity domain-containing protein [Streptomyces sp. NBRC 110611]